MPAATPASKSAAQHVGRVTQVIGSTFDVQFPENSLPTIYNAVKITRKQLPPLQQPFLEILEPTDLAELRHIRDVFDEAAAVDQQPFLFEQGRHGLRPERPARSNRAPQRVTRFVEREPAESGRQLLVNSNT